MTSYFVKTVSLKDWWLRKTDSDSSGNTLAIGGTESAGCSSSAHCQKSTRLQAARTFYSAPIVERSNIVTLKTADGIYVLLKGSIDKQKTCDNGFSEEVFKHFLFGFPPNWNECAEKYLQQGIVSEATADAGHNPEQSTSKSPLKEKSSKENVTGFSCGEVDATQISHIHHAAESMPKDTRTSENLISDNSPSQSKKRKRNERASVRSTMMTRSSLKRTRDRTVAEINANCTPKKNADILENSTVHHIVSKKSPRSEGERKKIVSGKSPRPKKEKKKTVSEKSPRSKNERKEIASKKSPTSKKERKMKKSALSTTSGKNGPDSAKQAVRSISRAQEIFCTPKREKKDSASQGSVLRTSRSGRLLLPPMEFWRNQSPIYDLDGGISGIRDDSIILKVEARKGGKYCTKANNGLLDKAKRIR